MERYSQPRNSRSSFSSAIGSAGRHHREGNASKLVGDSYRDQLERLGLHQLLRPAAEWIGMACTVEVLSVQVAPADIELLALLDAPLQTQACQPFSLLPFITRDDPRGGDVVRAVSAIAAERGGPSVRARL